MRFEVWLQVHTPLTTRAKELMQLYHGLLLPLLTVEERLDVLLHVKWTVKEFDCALTRDIVDLVRSCRPVHCICYSTSTSTHICQETVKE